MDLGLHGKRAFITGASQGIGRAIAHALLSEGASVSICARNPKNLEQAIDELAQSAYGGGSERAYGAGSQRTDEPRAYGAGSQPSDGPRVYGVVADVTDHAALGRAIAQSAEQFGGLDLVVANAGGAFGGDLLDSTPEDWAATYAINVLHAAHAVRAAVPYLEQSEAASVLIVASITGWKPGPKSSYASAKAAEIQLAATLARELGSRRIRVNALSPGSVLFEGGGWAQFRDTQPDRFEAFAREDFPAGRLVSLPEVADTACFLLSERASGINGANICVDGAQDHPSARRF